MSGLLAARVLADAYQRVTVVDRDPLPGHGADRKGVPQGRHAHALLPRGAQILGELFPGILAGLAAAGVPVLHYYREPWFSAGGTCCAARGNRAARAARGAGLSWKARSVAGSGPCLTSWSGTGARRPGWPRHRRVTGSPAPGCGPSAATTPRYSSRTWSLTPPAAVGGPGVAEGHGVRPAGRRPGPGRHHLRQPTPAAVPEALGETKLILIGAEPARPAALALFAQEHDRWILTLAGYAGRHPPSTRTPSWPSPAASPHHRCSPRSPPPTHSMTSAPTGSRPTSGAGTSGSGRSRPGCWLPGCDLRLQPYLRARHDRGRAGSRRAARQPGRRRPRPGAPFFRAAAQPVGLAWQHGPSSTGTSAA